MSCSGPCQQGKKPCPIPESCHLKQQDTQPADNDLLVVLSIVIGAWVAAIVVIPMTFGFFVAR